MKFLKVLVILSSLIINASCGGGGNGVNTSSEISNGALEVVKVSTVGVFQAKSNTSYISQVSTGAINYLLPEIPSLGDQVQIIGSEGAWTVQPNNGQTIQLNSFGGDVGVGEISFVPYEDLSKDVWNSISTSVDGSHLVAASRKGIYISSDYGKNWSLSHAPIKNYISIALSNDGRYVAAIAYQANGNVLYLSSDYGGTWGISNAPSSVYYQAVVISNDGNNLTAIDYSTGIYVSSDGGGTWSLSTGPTSVISIASSIDGSKLIVGAQSGIYTSSDYGSTWILSYPYLSSQFSTYGIASSGDGSHLVSQIFDNQNNTNVIYLSTNYGAIWDQLTAPVNDNYGISISGNGNRIVISTSQNGIYISDDNGLKWTKTGASIDLSWYGTALNYDGSRMSSIAMSMQDSPYFYYYAPSYYYWSNSRVFSELITNNRGVKGGKADALTLEYLGNGEWGVLNKVGRDFSNY
jgi:hypothetical protein